MKKPPRKRAPHRSPPAVAPVAPPNTDALLERIVTILEDARARVVRTVNSEMILAYWHIGREIVESVQRGEHRAKYGEAVIKALSAALTARFGRGFSISNIQYFRQFYVAFADRSPEIHQSAIGESRRLGAGPAIHPSALDEFKEALVLGARPPAPHGFSPALSWGHYRTLAKVEQADARLFYEIEAERAGWSLVDLERQIHTQLFARLRKSRDKAGLLDLVTRGLALQRPMDAIRDPYVLDFLDLPDAEQLHESDLEAAIIEKLQHFLLELGKGFAFVGRQKRSFALAWARSTRAWRSSRTSRSSWTGALEGGTCSRSSWPRRPSRTKIPGPGRSSSRSSSARATPASARATSGRSSRASSASSAWHGGAPELSAAPAWPRRGRRRRA